MEQGEMSTLGNLWFKRNDSGGLLRNPGKNSYVNFLKNLRSYEKNTTKPRLRASRTSIRRRATERTGKKMMDTDYGTDSGFVKRQQQLCDFLSMPKRRVIPYHKFIVKSDRANILKRKHKFQNTFFNY